MEIDLKKFKKVNGYLTGDQKAVSTEIIQEAIRYKKRVAGNFSPVSGNQIETNLLGSEFYVTRKIDGEMQLLFFNGKDAVIINGGGRIRAGLPCVEEAAALLKKGEMESAVIAAELCTEESKGRQRVYDVLHALSGKGDISTLRLAAFDIIRLNKDPFPDGIYSDTHKKLIEIFGEGEAISPVEMKTASSKREVQRIFDEWVEGENAEGIVVHSEFPRVFKVKPRQTIDAVIVGYTEGDGENRDKVRDILFALMKDGKSFQIIGKAGNGFTEQEKKDFYTTLSEKHIKSSFLETDSRNIAYHMVEPETVVEIAFTDILTETSKGIKRNPVLSIDDGSMFLAAMVPGISLIHPVYERTRTDKKANATDIRISQITDLIYIPEGEKETSSAELPRSEVIFREVYTKESKGKKMVLKFLVWKTNKQRVDNRYPAYVMHFTNFSPGRKDPLKRDVRVSSSEKQILEITNQFIEKNVKKGWGKIDLPKSMQ